MAHVGKELDDCIEACGTCHNVCLETSKHCLEIGGRHAEASHITLLRDCAEICRTSTDLMLAGSLYVHQICDLCAQICDDCEQGCGEFSEDFMKRCAETCRKCAETCREMVETRRTA